MKKIFEYFLQPYKNQQFSRKIKVRFLIATDIAMILIFPLGFVLHVFLKNHTILLLGDAIAFLSVILSFILIRADKSETAVNVLIGGIVFMVIVHNLLGDLLSADPVPFSRIVESAFIFIFLLIIIGMTSARRIKPPVFSVIFALILAAHFLIIESRFYPEGVSQKEWVFLTVYVIGMFFCGFLSSMMVYMTSDLLKVTEDQSKSIQEYSEYLENSLKTIRQKNKEIKSINQDLEKRVEERTSRLLLANEELETFNEITMRISQSLDFDEVFNMISELLTGIYGFEECAFFSLEWTDKRMRLEKVYSIGGNENIWRVFDGKPEDFAADSALLEKTGMGLVSFFQNDGTKIDDPLLPLPAFEAAYPLKTVMLLPIITVNETIGFFYLISSRGFITLHDEDIDSIKRLANQTALMLRNARLYAETIAVKDQLLKKNEVIEDELNMARKIQMQFIPDRSPSENIAFYYRSMEKVGGDFFDFVDVDVNKIGVFVSDVSGHGVPAAFVTSIIKTHIQQFARHIYSPADLLFHLNGTLCQMAGDQFVTAFYGVLDLKRLIFSYCNAGHVPPIIVSPEPDDPSMNLKTGLALGICEMSEMLGAKSNLRYRDEYIHLKKGMKILLFTDGMSEAGKSNDRMISFREAVMDEALRDIKPMNARQTIDYLRAKLVEFHGMEDFEDDVCIVCVQI